MSTTTSKRRRILKKKWGKDMVWSLVSNIHPTPTDLKTHRMTKELSSWERRVLHFIQLKSFE